MPNITINGEQITVNEEMLERIKTESGKQIIDDIKSYEDLIGKSWFIRTVTYHQVGRIVKIVGNFFQMESASWVADSGRFMQAMKTGELKEIEPVGTSFVAIGSIVDFFPWKHELPTQQK